jgi:hypothetical protein
MEIEGGRQNRPKDAFLSGMVHSKGCFFNTPLNLGFALGTARIRQGVAKFGITPAGLPRFLSKEPSIKPIQSLRCPVESLIRAGYAEDHDSP